MSFEVLTSFAFDSKRISYALKKIIIQLPFNNNTLFDESWKGLDFEYEEKIFLDQP